MARISILLPNLAGGGAERVQLDLAQEFARVGHEVEFVLLPAKGRLLEEALASFSIVDLATPRARSVPYALVRYLRERRPDALLAAMWPLTVIAPVAQCLSGHRCTVVVSEHNTLSVQYGGWGWLHRAALRASTALGYRLAHRRVCVSSGVMEDIAILSGLSSSMFDVIYNPIPSRPEPSVIALSDAELMWAGPPGARILTVGSIKAQKNHPLLLQAFARIDKPDARLMFVGEGSEREAMLSLAVKLGVADRVIFAGFQPDPTPFYKTADLFVLSSDYEGFGNVIVEAMACGTPVFSTDCPSGPREILDGGRYGRLVPVRDSIRLTDAIVESLHAPVAPVLIKSRAAFFAPQSAARDYLNAFGYCEP